MTPADKKTFFFWGGGGVRIQLNADKLTSQIKTVHVVTDYQLEDGLVWKCWSFIWLL